MHASAIAALAWLMQVGVVILFPGSPSVGSQKPWGGQNVKEWAMQKGGCQGYAQSACSAMGLHCEETGGQTEGWGAFTSSYAPLSHFCLDADIYIFM